MNKGIHSVQQLRNLWHWVFTAWYPSKCKLAEYLPILIE